MVVVLAQALQWCAIHSGRPPRMLCRTVQELCKCLAPLFKRGNLLDVTMLDVVEKDPMTPPIPTDITGAETRTPRGKANCPTCPQHTASFRY